jgi:hypothetical protein
MAKPSLTDIFGANAVQDGNTLIIDKTTDLASVGLSPSPTNTAESLLMAIILKAAVFLTEAAQDTNNDQVITVTKGSDNLITRNNNQYKEFGYDVKAQILDSQTVVDPDNF